MEREPAGEPGRETGAEAAYRQFRPLLFSIAYRMTGSAGEAEDIVQEAFLRWHRARTEGTEVDSPKAFLTTVATRLAIDHLRSARVRRESYAGPWLPEPLAGDGYDEVTGHAEMADSLSMAFMILLESLTPVERAVFLLREVFEYGYDEIAGIVAKSEPNVRQIFARARRRIDAGTPRFEASAQLREDLARRFFAASQQGDMAALLELLAPDVVLVGDGGGKAQALPQPVHGRERVGRLILGIFARGRFLGAQAKAVQVNGHPGGMGVDADGRLAVVWAFGIADGRIQTVWSVVNPDKLGHLGPVSDVARLPREHGN
jgi:RNA polymerase sigma-70 factor (ECF subfamily)